MKKFNLYIFTILLFFCFCFRASAYENLKYGLSVSPHGKWFSLIDSNGASQDMGYSIESSNDIYYATSENDFLLGNNGGSLVQCGLSFVPNHYYSVTYYFVYSTYSEGAYLHPYYSNVNNHVGVSNSLYDVPLTFNYSFVSNDVLTFYDDYGDTVGYFTTIFKSPNNGTCVNIAFSSQNHSYNSGFYRYLGYKYLDLGTDLDLGDSLNSVTGSLASSINNSENNIINNNNQNKNDIINNQNANNDKLIDNDNANTDKIIENNNANNDKLNDTINNNFNDCKPSINLFNQSLFVQGDLGYPNTRSRIQFKEELLLEPGIYTFHVNDNSLYEYWLAVYPNYPYKNADARLVASYFQDFSTSFTFELKVKGYFYLMVHRKDNSGLLIPEDFQSFEFQLQKGSSFTGYEKFGEEHCTNKMDQTNDKLDDLNSNITDSSIDNSKVDGFFGDFSTEDNGGISGVITSPLRFIRRMTDKCSPLNISMFDTDVSLPCGDTLFWNRADVSNFRITWNILVGAPIIYLLMIKLFKVIQNLKDPDNSKVEVLDL